MLPPESDQLVNVRSCRWVANEVQVSQLSPRPLEPTASEPQHLVSLPSVEDDALGEALQVIWEIESGSKVQNVYGHAEPQVRKRRRRLFGRLRRRANAHPKGHQAQSNRSRPLGSTYPDSRNAYPAEADRPDGIRRRHVGVSPSRSWQRLARSRRASQGSLPRPRLPAAQPLNRRGPRGPHPSRHPPPDHRDPTAPTISVPGPSAWPITNPTNSSRSSAPPCGKAPSTTVKKLSPPSRVTSASSG
jgi:hypothetical protein